MENDLISRSAIVEKLRAKSNEWRGSYTGDAYATAARMVSKEPAVDAVDVVRCKDCKYRAKWRHDGLYRCFNEDAGMAYGVVLRDNDFCSYGERRADNATD